MVGRGLVAGAVAALLAVAGCAESPARPAPSEDPPVSQPAPACVDAERRVARTLGMWRLAVPHTPGRGSEVARENLTRIEQKASARLAEECGEVPPGMAAFSEVIEEALTADVFGQEVYAQVLDAWLEWAEAVGAPRAAQSYVDGLRRCQEEFYPSVDATYDLASTPSDTGLVWTLDLTFDNRTGAVLDGSMWGEIDGTAVLPDPFVGRGPQPGTARVTQLVWGGSSADFLEVQPGTTSRPVGPDDDTDVHTTAEGRLRVVEFTAHLGIRGQRVFCPVVVQPAG